MPSRERALALKLDLQLFAQEKTERATPKKRQESRKKGQVAKSMEIPAALIMLFSFLILFMFGGFFKSRLYDLFTVAFREYMLWELSFDSARLIFTQLFFSSLIFLAPLMVTAVVVAFLGNYVQFGLLFSGEPLKMKLNKLNPIEGFKRIYSIRALVEFSKTILKLVIIGAIVFLTLWGEIANIKALSMLPLESALSYAARLTLMLGLQISAVLVILSIFDYMYQKYDYEKNLRMSKQDIKDEYKKTEGDPLIKSKIREKQRRMALQRMMQAVPQADVVITNPTHFAVALKYDAAKMEAPTVVAKGSDYLALRIKEVAKEHGIVTMENKPLARALFEQAEIGEAIPQDLFQAVAEILAYVYKLKGKVSI